MQKLMEKEINSQIIRRYFDANKTKNQAEVELLLADGFTFTSPYDDAIDRATYFERCWLNSEHRGENTPERVVVEGNEVFVTYRAVTNEGTEFRNTEFFVFAGDQIASVDVYFGASYKDGAFQKQQRLKTLQSRLVHKLRAYFDTSSLARRVVCVSRSHPSSQAWHGPCT